MQGDAGWNNQAMQSERPSKLDLLLESVFMLQYEFEQLTHVARCFRCPLRFVVLGAEERTLPLVTSKRGVVAKDGDVGAVEVGRGLTFRHVRVWGSGVPIQYPSRRRDPIGLSVRAD
jgi:hypothetical protein